MLTSYEGIDLLLGVGVVPEDKRVVMFYLGINEEKARSVAQERGFSLLGPAVDAIVVDFHEFRDSDGIQLTYLMLENGAEQSSAQLTPPAVISVVERALESHDVDLSDTEVVQTIWGAVSIPGRLLINA